MTTFQIVQEHKFSLTELEDMLPWERLVYLALIKQKVDKENARIQQLNTLNAQRK